MSLSPHARPRRRRPRAFTTEVRPLDPRTLLSTVPAFALFDGQVAGQAVDAISARVNSTDFRLASGGRVILRLETRAAADSQLDPGSANLGSSTPGGVRILSRRDNVPGGTASVTLASVRPGALTIRPTAQGGTEGDYTLGVSLAGDVNGDYRVDLRDLITIRLSIGRPADGPGIASGADVDGDGQVGRSDLTIALRNLGAATRVRPLETTLRLDPESDPDGDGRTDESEVDVIGQAAPGAIVRLDRGADGTFEATARAGSDGRYRFTVPLSVGVDPIAVEATDAFGQTAEARIDVARGPAAQPVSASFDFSQGAQGWEAGFADLPSNPNDTYELESGLRPLPAELGAGGTGYLLQSHNRSDDVFMFLKRRLGASDGVVPNQAYQVRFTIRFASNAPSGAFGVGGAPGEAVVLKAGAGPVEPRAVDQGGFARLNVDVGDQSQGGPAASVAGHIANGRDPEDPAAYVSLTRQHTHTFTARADAAGNLWLLVGTDSGFEGLTALFYQQIDVQLTPVSG